MKKLIIPIMALAFSFSLFTPFYFVKAEESNIEYKINGEFKCSKLKLKDHAYISDYKYEDINGDRVKDDIILIGFSSNKSSSPYRENIMVVVRDGKTEKYYAVSPGKIDEGVSAGLFLGDFDGDRVKDILVTIGAGGREENSWYSIFSFRKNKCKYLIDEEKFSRGLEFDIKYTDNFRVNVINKSLKNLYILDVENKRDTYTNLGIYNSVGLLTKEVIGSYDCISSLVPVDINNDGIYELKSIQAIRGICHADVLGYGKAIWKYSSKKMNLQEFDMLGFEAPGKREKRQRIIPVWAQ